MAKSRQSDAGQEGLRRVGLTGASREQMEQFCRKHETRVLTILLSDLEGSTDQQTRFGNVRAAELVQAHRELFRRALAKFDGQEVETAGDSFLVVFSAPSEAVKFALRMQAVMRRARTKLPALPLARVGIHQGQVVVERHADGPKAMDIYGLQVSTTARIMDLGRGGQILCSRAVFDDARAILRSDDLAGLRRVAWQNHGPYRFKGVADAYEVCEVGEHGLAPLEPPPSSGKGWPADQSEEELGWRPAVGVEVPGTNWVLVKRLGEDEPGPQGSRRYKGQFGEVWKAWNPVVRTQQVFKFCFKRDRVPALKREARLLKRLQESRHPNLVEIYDITAGDRPPYYLEMEFVDGPSLAEWLARGPSLASRLEMLAQVADALDTVHAAGIYHRDIKPSNILLTHRRDGTLQAKLTDFGLGAAEDTELLQSIYASRVDGIAGTWDYLAPELRTGGRPSVQSDLYSLGVTLYQVIVGDVRRPLGDWERQVKSEVLREDIRRCVATDPGDRWARASDLARALRGHDQRLREREHRRRAKRLRSLSAAILLFAIVVLGFGGYAWIQRDAADQQRREAKRMAVLAETERDEAKRQAELAIQAQRRADAALYHSNVLLAGRYIKAGRHEAARMTLWEAPEGPRNWEWGLLAKQCDVDLVTLEVSQAFGPCEHVAFSPDGTRVVTVRLDKRARIWNAQTGRLIAMLAGHERPVQSARFSPDGCRVLTASVDRTARLWDAATGRLVRTLEGHRDVVRDARFSPDGALIVTASDDKTARIWETATGDVLSRLEKHGDAVAVARFSPDGSHVVTASSDGTAWVWKAATGAALHCLRGHSAALRDAQLSPDGRHVVTASDDKTARVWDIAAGRSVATLDGQAGKVLHAQFLAGGRQVLTASEDGQVAQWAWATGQRMRTLRGSLVAVSHDGARVVVQSETGVQLIDLATACPLATLTGLQAHADARHAASDPGRVIGQFAPDGRRVVAACGRGFTRIWHTDALEGLLLHRDGTTDVDRAAFGADGQRLVTWSAKAGLWAWDAATGAQTHRLDLRDRDTVRRLLPAPARGGEASGVLEVRDARLGPKGPQALLGAGDRLYVWRAAATGKTLCLEGHQGPVSDAAFSPDGALVVSASADSTARIWDAATARRTVPILHHDAPVARAVFSRDGHRVLTASSGGTMRVWDTSSGKLQATLDGSDSTLLQADFSPDGRLVVTVGLSRSTATVWDTATGDERAALQGHDKAIRSARFSPDGRRILTASTDGTARVWDADTGDEVLRLVGPAGAIRTARFSPNGTRVITADDDAARVWPVPTSHQPTGGDAPAAPASATAAAAHRAPTRLVTVSAALVDLTAHGAPLSDAGFSRDGLRVVTVGKDKRVRVWSPAPWRSEDLPGKAPMDTPARFGLWRHRQQAGMLAAWWEQLRVWGEGHVAASRFAAALPVCQAMLSNAEERMALDPASVAALRDAATSHNWLGYVRCRLRRGDAAVSAYEAAADVARKWVAAAPEDARARQTLLQSYKGLGYACGQLRRGDGAVEAYRLAAAAAEAWATAQPAEAAASAEIETSYYSMAYVALGLHRAHVEREPFGSAERAARDWARASARAATSPDDTQAQTTLVVCARHIARASRQLAEHYAKSGDRRLARKTLERALLLLPDSEDAEPLKDELTSLLAAYGAGTGSTGNGREP